MPEKTILIFTRDGKLCDVFPCTTTHKRKEIVEYIEKVKSLFVSTCNVCSDCEAQNTEMCTECEKKDISVDYIIDFLRKKELVQDLNGQDFIRVMNHLEIGITNAQDS